MPRSYWLRSGTTRITSAGAVGSTAAMISRACNWLADRDGYFPWQQGYAAEFIQAQPDLTDGNWSGLREH